MITLQDVEQFIPLLKPLFDGMRSARDLFRRDPDRKKLAAEHASEHAIEIPKKTLIFLPEIHPFAVAWSLAKIRETPAMQITARLQATNTSKYGIRPSAAKLVEPNDVEIVQQMVHTQDPDSGMYGTNIIPPHSIGQVSLVFIVTPLTTTPGQSLKTSLLILDQFGNEHAVHLEHKFIGPETIG
jgi:hypothetical protein